MDPFRVFRRLVDEVRMNNKISLLIENKTPTKENAKKNPIKLQKRIERFSRLARPLQHQRTLINWGDANSQQAKEGGSFEECDAAKPRF